MQSLIESLTNDVEFGRPQSRSALVSFSVNKTSSAFSQYNAYRPSALSVASIISTSVSAEEIPRRFGFRLSRPQLQVLRNQIVGNRCSVAGSGPQFVAVARIKMSFGTAFAYSIS